MVNPDLGLYAPYAFQSHECIIYGITEGYPILSPPARYLASSCKIIAPSRYSAEKLRNVGIHVDMVIPFAVPPEPANKEEAQRIREFYKEKLGFKKIILWAGANMHRKGLDLICDVAEYLPSYAFVIYTGPGEIPLERIDGKNCFIVDKVFRGNIGDYYLASDLYLSTSRSEGFGLPPLEVLHFGKPSVLPEHPVLKERVGEYGYFYPVRGPRIVNFFNIMYMEYYEPIVPEIPEAIERALRKGVDISKAKRFLRENYDISNYDWFKRYTNRIRLF